jgi:hypothetical protein
MLILSILCGLAKGVNNHPASGIDREKAFSYNYPVLEQRITTGDAAHTC